VKRRAREWAPNGVDRFYNLARAGYFDDSRFYRVVSAFIAQFGIAGEPAIARLWSRRTLRMDSVRVPNARGTISYAQTNPPIAPRTSSSTSGTTRISTRSASRRSGA